MILVIKRSEEIISPFHTTENNFDVLTISEFLKKPPDLADYKALVILGGDGTIIRAIHRSKHVPEIYSFNFGTLGYLTTFNKDHIHFLPGMLKEKEGLSHLVRKRLLLSNNTYFLNETVFTSRTHRLNSFILNINNLELKLRGDSVIISTRTGSTGYNHSAGGPILLSDCIVINLVAPNKCNFRPVVVAMDSEIRVRTLSPDGLVISDGVEYESGDMSITYDGNEVQFVCYKGFEKNSFLGKLLSNEWQFKE